MGPIHCPKFLLPGTSTTRLAPLNSTRDLALEFTDERDDYRASESSLLGLAYSFIHSFIPDIYIALLPETYSHIIVDMDASLNKRISRHVTETYSEPQRRSQSIYTMVKEKLYWAFST